MLIPSPPHGSWISQFFTPSQGSESPHGSESQQPFTSFPPYQPSPKAPGHSSDLLRELHPRGQGGLIDPLPSYSHFQATCFLPEGPLATGQKRVTPLSVLTSAEHPQNRLPQTIRLIHRSPNGCDQQQLWVILSLVCPSKGWLTVTSFPLKKPVYMIPLVPESGRCGLKSHLGHLPALCELLLCEASISLALK